MCPQYASSNLLPHHMGIGHQKIQDTRHNIHLMLITSNILLHAQAQKALFDANESFVASTITLLPLIRLSQHPPALHNSLDPRFSDRTIPQREFIVFSRNQARGFVFVVIVPLGFVVDVGGVGVLPQWVPGEERIAVDVDVDVDVDDVDD
eukprot:CAMPEP_0172392700 /NCGR_PEP_ID=MMETSP1061-20121228/8740_1 /TAXON_ID=37318 /ORGANISM="Pseudo-nitzschia pungens, Strain cf. pungens" /LENGTH=149 /DNA_ID=CAMNT_0013123581 /DNA_START=823 /DNA_END=1268 /DNA_ORIENTATION=+